MDEFGPRFRLAFGETIPGRHGQRTDRPAMALDRRARYPARMRVLLLLPLTGVCLGLSGLGLGCKGKAPTGTQDSAGTEDSGEPGPPPTDEDGDGHWTPEDCDDGDPAIHPAATEVCDGRDNDCDGNVDVGEAVDARAYYKDVDADGFGDPGQVLLACNQPPGFVSEGTDCDDQDPRTFPGAAEICNDGADNNCNGDSLECSLSGELALSGALAIRWGEAGGDQAGSAIAAAGDVDGDGRDDLLVGAPYRDVGSFGDAGAAYLIGGAPAGAASLGSATATLTGTSRSDKAGVAVGRAGDVNADGYADVLVAAWQSDLSAADAGAVYLLHGPLAGTRGLATAEAIWTGEVAYDQAGVGLAGGVDLSGDGRPDLVVGAYGQGEGSAQSRGRVYLADGTATGSHRLSEAFASIDGAEAYDRLSALCLPGDLDGDGLPDLVVGAWSWPRNGNEGAVYAFHGPLTGPLTVAEADAVLEGEEGDGQAGTALARAGDVDGDGRADLLVGAPELDTEEREAGVAYLLRGPLSTGSLAAAPTRFLGTTARAAFGAALSAGDFDGDGRPDVLIGAPEADEGGTDAGGAWLFYAPLAATLSPADADLRFLPELARDNAGGALAFVGNLDGDCCEDLAIGAAASSRGGSSSGAIWIVLGQGL